MPENDEQDVSAGAQTPVETEREQFERERLTRRQALKKFGMTSAMATFALFSVDDLARMVGKAMQQRAGDNKVAEQVAREFQQAGIAMADGTNGCGTSGTTCQHCSNQLLSDGCYCEDVYSPRGVNPDSTLYTHCENQANYNFDGCVACHCQGGLPVPHNNTCPPAGQTQPPQGCNC